MRKTILIAGALALLAFAVPAASAGGKAATTVTMDFIQPTPGATLYTGDIFSSKKACKNKRKVFVFKVRAGADQKIGSTRSYKGIADSKYYWTVEDEDFPQSGKYYSLVKPTDACKGDRSPLYTY